MLLHGIEGHLRRAQFECPTSGTLFQLVLGYTALDDSAGSLKGFWVVPSEELPTLYGIRDITKSIQMLPQ